jgi:hypothetical protein
VARRLPRAPRPDPLHLAAERIDHHCRIAWPLCSANSSVARYRILLQSGSGNEARSLTLSMDLTVVPAQVEEGRHGLNSASPEPVGCRLGPSGP